MNSPERYESALQRASARARDLPPGDLPSYVPLLRRADPRHFAISIALAEDGVLRIGDSGERFSLQSVSKVLAVAKLAEIAGTAELVEALEMSSSPHAFHSLELAASGKPFNPMVNTGALVVSSNLCALDVGIDEISAFASQLAGAPIRDLADEARAALAVGDRNREIARMLAARGLLAPGVGAERALELYYRQCFLMMNTDELARAARGLAADARYGFLPAMLRECGLYGFSAEWRDRAGFAAKNAVSGAILGILPGGHGVAIYAPGVDDYGTSVRGLAAAEELGAALGGV